MATVIQTSQKTEVINVTQTLADVVTHVQRGLVLFSLPHTTAALVIAEDDTELRYDFVHVAENMLAGLRPFKHIRKNNPNAEAHIISAFAGTSVTLAVEEGKLLLGSYQHVLLLEMDGPKAREIHAAIIQG